MGFHPMNMIEASAGEEKWICPICSRTFILRPDWTYKVTEEGDTRAIHIGTYNVVSPIAQGDDDIEALFTQEPWKSFLDTLE